MRHRGIQFFSLRRANVRARMPLSRPISSIQAQLIRRSSCKWQSTSLRTQDPRRGRLFMMRGFHIIVAPCLAVLSLQVFSSALNVINVISFLCLFVFLSRYHFDQISEYVISPMLQSKSVTRKPRTPFLRATSLCEATLRPERTSLPSFMTPASCGLVER